MRIDQVGAETRALRRTSRVGPWADPFPAIHGGLIQLIERHDLSPHLYADDTQVYGSCRPSTQTNNIIGLRPSMTAQLLDRMSECLADVAA